MERQTALGVNAQSRVHIKPFIRSREHEMKLWIGVLAAACVAFTGCASDSTDDSSSVAEDIGTSAPEGIVELDGTSGTNPPSTDAGDPVEDSGTAMSDTAVVDDVGTLEPPSGAICPSAHFMDLSGVDGPGALSRPLA